MEDDKHTSAIAHVVKKPPEFTDTNPNALFCIIEAQFE